MAYRPAQYSAIPLSPPSQDLDPNIGAEREEHASEIRQEQIRVGAQELKGQAKVTKELEAAIASADPSRLGKAIAAARQHGVDSSLVQKAEAALQKAEQARGTPR